ncbi:uncharacterized protein LOC115240640 isoform X2 [Formica exsecta]|uniref:uncharacterized protein LOC115240640 isoform X1 n=1 Tax=Formica exsecta TaxID=72781 RepID=UPI001143F731|nr:uncharacterized protein LOC115240640 isoform X1 [Formica exsecta]XP_029671777.1 uncharacterized protein LOC115240640 isoform X2 [Formica exsecta]
MFRETPRFVLLILIAIFHCGCGDDGTSRANEKRHGGTNNYQMCLDSFDIHRDKIIKTQDSRDMGAKYLSVSDVDSRLDCLKYCCETERCDVFIFEEKKPGSCYLFQCGPLHDFKCKFTRHANYTSAVRTSYPIQNIQVEEEVRISQQEHELKSLRKGSEITLGYGFTETPSKSIVTQIPKVILTTPASVKPACSRNQYECRSSGDCIAIYNVCDGIPQCTDGSDEAADLVCPTEKPTVPPNIQVPHPPADILQYPQMVERKPLPPFYPAAPEINPKTWEISNLAHQMSQPQNILYPGQPVELPQMRKNFGSSVYQWDYQPPYEQNKDLYIPVNTFHEQNINPYEQQPHIFNHKGSSVIGNNEANRELYVDSKRPYTSHFPSSNKIAWQNNPVQLLPSIAPNSQHNQAGNVEDSAKITTTPVCDTSEEHRNELMQNKEFVKKKEKANTHLIHSGFDTKASKQVTEKSTLLASDIIKHNHAKESKDHKNVIVIEDHHVRAHEKTDIIAEHLQIIEDDVLRPKGAVVSLSLGLIATAITAALIVCRLRVVKRRGRCGHGPYAHDADYLVNGMYL